LVRETTCIETRFLSSIGFVDGSITGGLESSRLIQEARESGEGRSQRRVLSASAMTLLQTVWMRIVRIFDLIAAGILFQQNQRLIFIISTCDSRGIRT
jgi:hypothetical protein